MTTVYHRSPVRLPPDLILEPRFGLRPEERARYDEVNKVLLDGATGLARLVGNDDGWSVYVRETIFELVRRDQAPWDPPRLGGIFGCRDVASLARCMEMMGEPASGFYECEVVNGDLVELDMTFIENFPAGVEMNEQVRRLRALAGRYWSRERSAEPALELIIRGTVRVIRPVYTGEGDRRNL